MTRISSIGSYYHLRTCKLAAFLPFNNDTGLIIGVHCIISCIPRFIARDASGITKQTHIYALNSLVPNQSHSQKQQREAGKDSSSVRNHQKVFKVKKEE